MNSNQSSKIYVQAITTGTQCFTSGYNQLVRTLYNKYFKQYPNTCQATFVQELHSFYVWSIMPRYHFVNNVLQLVRKHEYISDATRIDLRLMLREYFHHEMEVVRYLSSVCTSMNMKVNRDRDMMWMELSDAELLDEVAWYERGISDIDNISAIKHILPSAKLLEYNIHDITDKTIDVIKDITDEFDCFNEIYYDILQALISKLNEILIDDYDIMLVRDGSIINTTHIDADYDDLI